MDIRDIRDYVRISVENSKMGEIPNISLPPIKTCIDNPACASDCYALRAYNRWRTVKNAWDLNYKTYRNNPELYFNCISQFIENNRVKHFRWHTSGDIPDLFYLFNIVNLSILHNKTKFLVFTKKYNYIRFYDNNYKVFEKYGSLKIILSAWKGLELPDLDYPIAFTADDSRKFDYIKCKGRCDKCFECWNINKGTNLCLKKI